MKYTIEVPEPERDFRPILELTHSGHDGGWWIYYSLGNWETRRWVSDRMSRVAKVDALSVVSTIALRELLDVFRKPKSDLDIPELRYDIDPYR
jgi:hypothetical protein